MSQFEYSNYVDSVTDGGRVEMTILLNIVIL